MSVELNLFPKKIQKIRQQQHLRFLVTRILLGLLIVLAFLMISLSGYSLVIVESNKNIEAKINSVEQKIVSLKGLEMKQVYLLSKLKSFEGLIKTQEKHQAITETIFALLPQNTSLKDFQVAEDGVIKLSGSVPDYLTFTALLNNLRKSNDYRLPITKSVANKVSSAKDGTITFDIVLTIAVKS